VKLWLRCTFNPPCDYKAHAKTNSPLLHVKYCHFHHVTVQSMREFLCLYWSWSKVTLFQTWTKLIKDIKYNIIKYAFGSMTILHLILFQWGLKKATNYEFDSYSHLTSHYQDYRCMLKQNSKSMFEKRNFENEIV
jgi:hypothetical protein